MRVCAFATLTLLVLAGCARPERVLLVGPLVDGLDPFLAAHPLAAGQGLRADEAFRTSSASYHVVQVATGETPHQHRHHDLTVVVVRGTGVLVLGSARIRLGPGDVVAVPRRAPHWFTRTGRAPAVALVVFTPPLDAPDTAPVDDVDSHARRR